MIGPRAWPRWLRSRAALGVLAVLVGLSLLTALCFVLQDVVDRGEHRPAADRQRTLADSHWTQIYWQCSALPGHAKQEACVSHFANDPSLPASGIRPIAIRVADLDR